MNDEIPATERAAVESLLGSADPTTVTLLRVPVEVPADDLPLLAGPGNGQRVTVQGGRVVQIELDQVQNTSGLGSLPGLIDVALDGPFERLHLEGFSQLRRLTVYAVRQPDQAITLELATLPDLRSVACSARPLRQAVFRGTFAELRELSLLGGGLTRVPAIDAPNLHTLSLSSNPLVGLSGLGRFEKLERLELSGTGLESTAGIPSLPELLSLRLDGNPLLGAIDADLAQRLPDLKRLTLRRTAVFAAPAHFAPDVRIDLDEAVEFAAVLARLRESHKPSDGKELLKSPGGSGGTLFGRSGRCTWKTSTFSPAKVSCNLTIDRVKGTPFVELGTTDAALPFQGGGHPRIQASLTVERGSARVLVRHSFDLISTARVLVEVDDATAEAARRPGDSFDGYRASAPAAPGSPATVRGQPTLLASSVVVWIEQTSSEPVEGVRLVVEPIG